MNAQPCLDDQIKTAAHFNRKIVHIDMDCFYAAVEVLDQPQLEGKPVIVGGTHRGVVCAASYEARKYGVKSAMPIFQAKKLCKKGIFLPVRMHRYKEMSSEIRKIFFKHTDMIQPISLDEAFLDVTVNNLNLYATEVAKEIKKDIKNKLGLVASAGVAPNKFLAKVASDYDKPDGFYVIRPHEVESFMKNLPVKKMWGVGKVLGEKLENIGIHVAGDFSRFPNSYFLNKFGQMGKQLLSISKGIDHSKVKNVREAKSIGRERTLEENLIEKKEILQVLQILLEDALTRLRMKRYKCRGVQLKIKDSNFKVITRRMLLKEETNDYSKLYECIPKLTERTSIGSVSVRLLGISFFELTQESGGSENLFELL